MKNKIIALSLVSVLFSTLSHSATFESEWCSVDMPASVKPGEKIIIDVTLKNDPGANQLDVHLHWIKADNGGWGGMLAWHPPRNAQKGSTTRFTFSPELNPAIHGAASPIVFLAPEGDFSKLSVRYDPGQIKVANADGAEAKIDSAALAKQNTDHILYRLFFHKNTTEN
ncbi:MAG: hypothetical protein FWG05_05835, partial [Kiritimatiellaeota bacterium]|nr:hypothetical protein [Kiritimatiellota bacterium]